MWQGSEMATWVVLLRGINVGGANRLAMADLRTLMTELGHTGVSTYIQSGNALITSSREDRSEMAAEICEGIAANFGPVVSAVLRTPEELRASLAANPFSRELNGTRVHITFFAEAPETADVAQLEQDRFLPDRFEVIGAEMYNYYEHGAGRSKMTLDYFEKKLHVRGTARNLNTVAKLIELSTA